MYIFVIAWILSPLVLIPLSVKKSKESSAFKRFIDELYSAGKISTKEYLNLEAEKSEGPPKEPSAPIFEDSREFSKVHGGAAVRSNNAISDEKSFSEISVEKSAVSNTAEKIVPETKINSTAESKPATEINQVKKNHSVTENYDKYLNDIPVYKAEKSEIKTSAKSFEADVKPVTEQKEYTKKVHKGKKSSPDKKRAAAMSVLMMIGIIFVVLAGLIFSTAVWTNIGKPGRTCAIGVVSALFFGISAFAKKKLKLERTSFAFYTLGTFFSSITLLTAGFYGLTGSYFSVNGGGSFLLYGTSLLIISLLSAIGRRIFNISAAAYISAISGAFSAVLMLVWISPDLGVFALLSALLTAAANALIYALREKKSDKWEKPLRTAAAMLNIIALTVGISASFGNSSAFYAAAAVFVIRAAAAIVMGFKGRGVYETSLAAVSSLASGALFTLLIIWKLSPAVQVFALSSAVFAILFSFGMFTFNINIPEHYKTPIKTTAFILNTIGVISSLYALMRNFGDWNGICFAVAGIYILSSFAVGILAVKGHHIYGETSSGFASMFIGLTFSVMLVAELSESLAAAALCLTVLLLVIINTVYTVSSKLPQGWKYPVGISAAILGLISVLSSLFVLIDFIGKWDAACYTISVLYILQSLIISVAAYRGHSVYSKRCWSIISQLAGIVFSVMTLSQLIKSDEGFILSLTVFAVTYLNFVYTFKLNKPENWKTTLKVFSWLLGIVGIIFTVNQMGSNFEWSYQIYISVGIYIAYAIAITAMAFLKHEEYSKRYWAIVSQLTGIPFIIALLSNVINSDVGFMLSLTVFAVAYLNFVHTFGLKKPANWETPLKIFSWLLGIVGIIFTVNQMLGQYEWSYQIYISAGIYIAYTAAVTVMAFLKHEEYSKRYWAIVSQLTGISFIIALLSNITNSDVGFMLSLTVFAVAYLNFVHTFKLNKPTNWEIPLKVFSWLLGIVGIIFTVNQMCSQYEWSYQIYISVGIYIAYSAAVTVMAFLKHEEYSKRYWAVVSQLAGISFIIVLLLELTKSSGVFILPFTVFAVAYLNFVHTLKLNKPEKWEAPLKIFSWLLGIIGTIFCQINIYSKWSCHIISEIIYIVYAIAVTVMAFLKHEEYSKRCWAVVSQLTGILFTMDLISRITKNDVGFALLLTVFAVAYLNFVHTFNLNKPEKWKTPLKIFSWFLGISSLIFTAVQMGSYSEWTYQIYISVGIYIAYSAAVTVMAYLKHEEYSKRYWAVVSQLAGIILSLCVVYMLVSTTLVSSELFVLLFAIMGALYSAAVYLTFLKTPEKWLKVMNAADIIFNIAAAFSAARLMVNNIGSWNIYCFLTAFLYIAYTASRGILNKNRLLKGLECIISSLTAFNIYSLMADSNIIVPEFFLVCMLFAILMIHRYIKPLRTLFSDVYLIVILTLSAIGCSAEYSFCGIVGFALLGAAMLINASEKENKLSAVYKAFLPLPVSGMVFAFACHNIDCSFVSVFGANAAVLAVIAAAIMFIRKKTDASFYSFAFTSLLMIFIGSKSDSAGMLLVLIAASVLLTVLFCRCNNNIPSLFTMAGTAAVIYSLAENVSFNADFNVQLLFGILFAVLSLAASRAFFSRRLLIREDGRFVLDTCCAGMLMALPMISSPSEKITVFTVLTVLAAFAANLARKEHKDDANRVMLTIGSGLFTLALIFRPFLIVSDILVTRKITLGIICLFGYVFSKIWAKYPGLAENFPSVIYGISFISLIIDALSHQNLVNTLIVLTVSAAILLYSFISKKKRWFAISSVSLTGLTVYMFRDFFTMIDWWVYLLIVGFILIAVSAANEYFVRKGREIKEKVGRFFEDWKW